MIKKLEREIQISEERAQCDIFSIQREIAQKEEDLAKIKQDLQEMQSKEAI